MKSMLELLFFSMNKRRTLLLFHYYYMIMIVIILLWLLWWLYIYIIYYLFIFFTLHPLNLAFIIDLIPFIRQKLLQKRNENEEEEEEVIVIVLLLLSYIDKEVKSKIIMSFWMNIFIWRKRKNEKIITKTNTNEHKNTSQDITAQPTTIQDEKNESKLSLNEYQESIFFHHPLSYHHIKWMKK